LSQELIGLLETGIRICFNQAHFYAFVLDHHEVVADKFECVAVELQMVSNTDDTLDDLGLDHAVNVAFRYLQFIAQLAHTHYVSLFKLAIAFGVFLNSIIGQMHVYLIKILLL
jgi:hypothetical protein